MRKVDMPCIGALYIGPDAREAPNKRRGARSSVQTPDSTCGAPAREGAFKAEFLPISPSRP